MIKIFSHIVFFTTICMANIAQSAVAIDFSKIVERHQSAVVKIKARKKNENNELLGRFLDKDASGSNISNEIKIGSGFFIAEEGYLITSEHVINGCTEITIILNNQEEVEVEIVDSNQNIDIALLKTKSKGNYNILKFSKVDKTKVGQPVLALGAPYGFDISASAGIVSARSKSDNILPYIQTDITFHPGNSGGPLLNKNGAVIAVNSKVYSNTNSLTGLSFSIPIDTVVKAISSFKTK